ncbi:hypothetical protein, partial [uncultured Comamonas sp.]|uniref:hypothetical protein n=1 Tax=uncultured Comamonas sp. TaxID=114710 RepID=UPI002612DC87
MTPEAIEANLVPLLLESIRSSSKLEPSTPLYRITDFFSLAQMLSEQRLEPPRFPRRLKSLRGLSH